MNKPTNNANEVKYDGIKNITYEFLEKSVISADIGNPDLSSSDTIIDLTPMRYYQGKVLDDSAKIGFRVCVTGLYEIPGFPEKGLVKEFSYNCAKIVFVADEERIEVDLGELEAEKKEDYIFLETEIVGLNNNCVSAKKSRQRWENAWKDIVLQPDEIKRIADAKDVGVYINAFNLIDVNGGTINFRDSFGSFKIEGIQGAMKRAYHYFVDETSYTDYCISFLKKKKRALEETKKRIEEEHQQMEQQRIQQEESVKKQEETKRKAGCITIIVLAVSILLFVLGAMGVVGIWTFFLGGIGVFLCIGVIGTLNKS